MPTLKQDPTETPIGAKALAFLNVKQKIAVLEKEKKVLQPELMTYSDIHGTKNEKGSINCVVAHNGVKVNLYQECRSSTGLVPEFLHTLKEELEPDVYAQLIENVPTVKMEVLEEFILNETISNELRDRIMVSSDSYAFKPAIVKGTE